jgi:hypothetical protein
LGGICNSTILPIPVILNDTTMNKVTFLILMVVLFSTKVFGQATVDVAETTLKIDGLGGEEVFYYGFAEGDQLIFNFQEVNGKELKEIGHCPEKCVNRFFWDG